MYLDYLKLTTILDDWQPLLADGLELDWNWSTPVEPEHGLLTTNLAFLLAKHLGRSPVQIALELQLELQAFISATKLPLSVETAGPYLNLKLLPEFYRGFLNYSLDYQLAIKQSVVQDDRLVLFDYVGANVAKRLHAGHMRNLNIGDALRRVLQVKHPNFVTDNHWGDWGVQFGILLWGWKAIRGGDTNHSWVDFTAESLDATYAADPVNTLQKIYVLANAAKASEPDFDQLVRQEFLMLEAGDPENRRLWQDFVAVSKADLKQDLELFHVPPLDLEQGESFYESDMGELTKFMNQHRIWKQEGQARYFDFAELVIQWPALPPDLAEKMQHFGRVYLISSSGYTSYCFRDVAARLQWARNIQADLMLTVTDKTQRHNFDQAFAVICYLASLPDFRAIQTPATIQRLQWSNLIHVGYGFLSLPEGKMSTRQGNVLPLRELVTQVQQAATVNLQQKNSSDPTSFESKSAIIALAALKWFDLARDYEADIILNIPQILDFEGNTGVYQLYTYARLQSILRKASEAGCEVQTTAQFDQGEPDFDILKTHEKLIIQQMFGLPAVLESICTNYKPHLLCNHLYGLTSSINRWYNDVPILKEENIARRSALLKMVKLICQHLQFSLDLLGIKVLPEM